MACDFVPRTGKQQYGSPLVKKKTRQQVLYALSRVFSGACPVKV